MSETDPREKTQLREKMRALRQSLSPEEVLAASEAVREHLLGRGLDDNLATICAYAHTGKEIRTDFIIGDLLEMGKVVCVPDWEGWHRGAGLRLVRILSTSELVTDGRIVPQPEVINGRLVAAADVDLFLVPGLAFDRSLTRLGMGGGYFDRLLSGAAPGAILTGLAHDFQIVSKLPREAHDIPMTTILCPTTGLTDQMKHIQEGRAK